MATFIDPNNSSGSSFNYNSEQAKINRRRKAADYLQNLALQEEKGQFIKSGDFTGYAGGATPFSAIARVLAGTASSKMNSEADADQSALDANSAQASQQAIGDQEQWAASKPWATRAANEQIDKEAAAQLLRESKRGPIGI